MFSDQLEAAGELMETGASVLVSIEADGDGESLRLRVTAIQSLEKAARKLQNRLTVTVKGKTDWPELVENIKEPGTGRISLIVQLPRQKRQVTFELEGRFDVSPGRAALIKSLPGVLAVDEHGG